MRFSLLPLLLLLLEAPGCTDLLEVWLMNHTWALKYRGVFMACSTGSRIYLQQNFRPPHRFTALSAAAALCVTLWHSRWHAGNFKKSWVFFHGIKGISDIKVMKTENGKRNFNRFLLLFVFFLVPILHLQQTQK